MKIYSYFHKIMKIKCYGLTTLIITASSQCCLGATYFSRRRLDGFIAERYRLPKSAVEPFSLFCFIIDSPDKDKKLSDYVGREFIHLHIPDGRRFTFPYPYCFPPGWRRLMNESAGSWFLSLYRKIKY